MRLAGELAMPPSLQVTFRNLLPSEMVIALVRDRALQLAQDHVQVVGCHATVVAEEDRARCRVALELSVKQGPMIGASRGIGVSMLERPDNAVLQAFKEARSELARDSRGRRAN
jgi:hypothetical protein